MSHQTMMGRSLQAAWRCLLLFLFGLGGSLVHAQAPAQEQALTRTARDAQLKWGPCPPFLPKGCGIAVLHGDPAKDNVDVFLKVPGKSTLPLHWHSSAERMVLVAGELHVTYDSQKTEDGRSKARDLCVRSRQTTAQGLLRKRRPMRPLHCL